MDHADTILSKFGLTESEIKVYRATLSGSNHSPFTLSKATGIPRTTVYDILMNLSLKGLVELQQSDGYTKQQTKVTAKNPSILRSILQQKRKDLVGLETDIVGILPFLKGDYHKRKPDADFQFFPGIEGFRKVYADTSYDEIDAPRLTWDVLMPMDVIGEDVMNEIVNKQLEAESTSRHFRPKEIVALNDWTRHVLAYQYGRDKRYVEKRDIRYVENPSFGIDVEMSIVGSHILVFCAKEDEVWAMHISSKAMSSTLRSIFLLQWMDAKELTTELVESWGPSEMLEYERKRKLKR